MTGLLAPPEEVYAAALRGRPCTVHGLASRPAPLPVASWRGEAGPADRALLAHCTGPTLDVGCRQLRRGHAGAARILVNLLAK